MLFRLPLDREPQLSKTLSKYDAADALCGDNLAERLASSRAIWIGSGFNGARGSGSRKQEWHLKNSGFEELDVFPWWIWSLEVFPGAENGKLHFFPL